MFVLLFMATLSAAQPGFNPNDDNREQWPLPNVLGVLREGTH